MHPFEHLVRRVRHAAALMGVVLALPAAAETLMFSPMPMERPEAVVTQWRPLLNHLEKVLGVDFRIVYPASNADIVDKFRNGEIGLAHLGPLPYMELKQAYPEAVPVVRLVEADGQAKYTCAIIALADRKLTVDSLRDKTFALTQPLSTCGFLAVDGILHKVGSGLEHNRFRYLGNHEKVALAVARGDVDAGGVKTDIGRRYEHLGVRVIAESGAFPSFALVANPKKISARQIAQIRATLLEADEATRAGWGGLMRHGVVEAADEDYEALRSHRHHAVIPLQGNY